MMERCDAGDVCAAHGLGLAAGRRRIGVRCLGIAFGRRLVAVKPPVRFAARAELYRTCGVDLTQVPGLQSGTALVLVGELGPHFAERFPTAKHFASWLGICPDNRITGGKIMSSATREVKSRAATALRLAAQALNKAQNYFGDLYRRWKARLGTPKAITAMAHT